MGFDVIADTTGLLFFHGTSKKFAKEIQNQGANERFLSELRAFELGDELAGEIRTTARIDKNGWLPSSAFPDADRCDLTLADHALLRRDASFQYGGYFATLNYEIAKCYALAHPHGSEYLRAIMAGLRILKWTIAQLPDRYSRLKTILLMEHEPAIVETSGIPFDRLLPTKESPSLEHTLTTHKKHKNNESVRFPLSVQIVDLQPTEVRKIHVLGDF